MRRAKSLTPPYNWPRRGQVAGPEARARLRLLGEMHPGRVLHLGFHVKHARKGYQVCVIAVFFDERFEASFVKEFTYVSSSCLGRPGGDADEGDSHQASPDVTETAFFSEASTQVDAEAAEPRSPA